LHRHYLPYRSFSRADVLSVVEDDKYTVDVEMWPTNTVLDSGESLILEIAGHDTQGVGLFSHQHPEDRAPSKFSGLNHVEVGKDNSWILLPVIPPRSQHLRQN
jgi:hypothetical protein